MPFIDPDKKEGLIDLMSRALPATEIGNKQLFQVIQPFAPLWVVFGLRHVAGFTSVPTVSLGTNSPNFNNILAAVAATGVDVAGEYRLVSVANPGNVIAADSTITARCSVAAVATTYEVDIHLLGVYV